MLIRKKIRKKKSKTVHAKVPGMLVTVACVILLIVSAVDLRENFKATLFRPNPSITDTPIPAEALYPQKKERPVYPYSIIPGGVLNQEELAAKIAEDPSVAEHYAGFNISKSRVVPSEAPRYAYVSYRLQNKIYWTSKKIKIPQGESIITDGQNEARTRCGNRVSASPLEPTSEEEPALESFDIPEMPVNETVMDPTPTLALGAPFDKIPWNSMLDPDVVGEPLAARLDTPPDVDPKKGFPPNNYYWSWPDPPKDKPVPPPSPVPEVNSIIMIMLGLIAVIVYVVINKH